MKENEKQETGNRKWETGKWVGRGELTGFEFPVSGFLFSILFSRESPTGC